MTATSKVYNVDGDVVIVLPQLSDRSRALLTVALEGAFCWAESPEGDDYWRHVHEALSLQDYDDVPSNTTETDDPDLVTFRWTGSGNKVSAIKLWRALTGVGLKDAKDAVERSDTLRINLHEARHKLLEQYGSDEYVWGSALHHSGMVHDTRIFKS